MKNQTRHRKKPLTKAEHERLIQALARLCISAARDESEKERLVQVAEKQRGMADNEGSRGDATLKHYVPYGLSTLTTSPTVEVVDSMKELENAAERASLSRRRLLTASSDLVKRQDTMEQVRQTLIFAAIIVGGLASLFGLIWLGSVN